MNVFLIGLMGSGKSYWGKHWAEMHQLSFFDLDEIIEQSRHQSISDIFESSGEKIFREIESDTLRSLPLNYNAIIACGGGTPCFHNNLEWMHQQGITVYLQVNPNDIADRLATESHKRPLISNMDKGQIRHFLQQQLSEREYYFEQATITITANSLSADSFTEIISRQKNHDHA